MKDDTRASKKKMILGIILTVIVIIGCLLGYLYTRDKRSNSSISNNKTYKIGAILPLSGSLGFMGKMEGDGMMLAMEDINARGGIKGIPIELKLDDSQGKPDTAVTAVQKMMTIDGIDTIVASFSSVTLGIKPVVERNNGILIGACMHPVFFKDAPNTFRFYIGVEDESQGFVSYFASLKTDDNPPRIGCLYVEAPNVVEQLEGYIEPGLAEIGLALVVKEPYRLSDKEFRDKILKLRSANLTHLLIIGYGFLYPNIFREMKDQKLFNQVEIVGGWGFLYPNVDPEDLEDVVVVGPSYVFSQAKPIEEFYSKFEKRFGYEANFDAVMTYAAIQILSHGIMIAESRDVSSVIKSLSGLKRVETLLGLVDVTSDGAVSFEVGIGRFHNGRLTATN